MPPRAAVASQFRFIDAEAAVQRLLGHLDDGDGNAGIGERHRDAAAHGAGADDGDALDLARLHLGGHAGDLGGLALGEERIALRLRLFAVHQFEELLALERHALVEGAFERLGDALGAGERRDQAAVAAVGRSGGGVERVAVGLGGGEFGVVIANALQRALLGQNLAGKGFTGLGRIAGEQFLDQADLQAFSSIDRIAA